MKETIFSVFIIADFIDSSFEYPFCIELQYFLEKFLEILFCNKLTLGSEVVNAEVNNGLNKKIKAKNNPQIYLNNSYDKFFLLL